MPPSAVRPMHVTGDRRPRQGQGGSGCGELLLVLLGVDDPMLLLGRGQIFGGIDD